VSSASSSAKSEKTRLINIIEERVVQLLKQNGAARVDSVFDASFIKAWSIRDPLYSQTGYSDKEARVGRSGRSFGLGYKRHLSIDSKTMLPLACTFASANQNEQKHSLNILKKTELILKQSAAKLKSVIADSQYSDGKLGAAVDAAVIPYRANQKRDVEGLLRVDKKFRTYGPEDEKIEYHKRPHVEAVYSFLKTQYSLTVNKVRGLGNVASYALFSILCLVLNREAAENIRRYDKVSFTNLFQHVISGQGSALLRILSCALRHL
jgi:hypothetical protein